MVTITIPGRPVPAQRMTQATKWSDRARRSLDYQKQVALIAKSQVRTKPLPWKYVKVDITVYLKAKADGELPGNRGDWDNYAKAICDGLQYGEIFANDRAITAGALTIEPCASASEERAEVTLSERIMATA